MANPPTYTVQKSKKVIAALREGKGVQRAADEVGVTRKTIYNWKDQHPDFAQQFEDAQEGVTDGIEMTVIQKALSGDVTAGIFMLKSRRREVYGEKWQGEITGKDGGPVLIFGTDTKGPQ